VFSPQGLVRHPRDSLLLLPHSPIPSSEDNPPAHPRIVAAVAALGRLGEGLIPAAERCPSSACLPLPSCTHSSSMLGVSHC
jgi:hypothetical protein